MERIYLVLEYCRGARAETDFFFVAIDSTDPDDKVLRVRTEPEREGCWREHYLLPKRTWVLGMRRTGEKTYFKDFWIEEDALITRTLERIPLPRGWRRGFEAEVHQPDSQ